MYIGSVSHMVMKYCPIFSTLVLYTYMYIVCVYVHMHVCVCSFAPLIYRVTDFYDLRRKCFGGENKTAPTATTAEKGRDETISERAEEKEENNSQTARGAAPEEARGKVLVKHVAHTLQVIEVVGKVV